MLRNRYSKSYPEILKDIELGINNLKYKPKSQTSLKEFEETEL